MLKPFLFFSVIEFYSRYEIHKNRLLAHLIRNLSFKKFNGLASCIREIISIWNFQVLFFYIAKRHITEHPKMMSQVFGLLFIAFVWSKRIKSHKDDTNRFQIYGLLFGWHRYSFRLFTLDIFGHFCRFDPLLFLLHRHFHWLRTVLLDKNWIQHSNL